MPCPTPMHMVARARRAPRSCSSSAAVSASRAPLAPSGWPSAIAPPFGLTCSASSGRPELPQHGQRLRGERLVQLDHVDVADAQARCGRAASAWPAPGRCPSLRGGTPATAPTVTRASGVQAVPRAPRRSEATSTAAAPSLMPGRVAGGHGAARGERPQLGQRLERGRPRVLVDRRRPPARPAAAGPAPARSPWPAGRRRSPWRRAPASAARTRPGRPGRCRSRSATFSAVSGIESVPYRSRIAGLTNRQPIVVSWISARPRPRGAGLGHDERRAGHALHAAGDDQVGVAGADRPGRDGDGVQPGAAQPVHRAAGHLDRQARRAARPSGRRCGCPRRPGWRSRARRRPARPSRPTAAAR